MTVLTWSEEREARLKELWDAGLSASQIAAELGNVTRNAVIGRVHRLGLSGRAKSPASAAPRQRKPRPVGRMSLEDFNVRRSPKVSTSGKISGLKGSRQSIDKVATESPADWTSLKKRSDDLTSDVSKEIAEKLELLISEVRLRNLAQTTLPSQAEGTVSHTEPSPSLPLVAPKLWKSRAERFISPADFIADVYRPWLGRLTLSDVRDLDPQLAQQYSNWLSKGNTPPAGFVLPTQFQLRSSMRAVRAEARRLAFDLSPEELNQLADRAWSHAAQKASQKRPVVGSRDGQRIRYHPDGKEEDLGPVLAVSKKNRNVRGALGSTKKSDAG
jgi:hypothetical protein